MWHGYIWKHGNIFIYFFFWINIFIYFNTQKRSLCFLSEELAKMYSAAVWQAWSIPFPLSITAIGGAPCLFSLIKIHILFPRYFRLIGWSLHPKDHHWQLLDNLLFLTSAKMLLLVLGSQIASDIFHLHYGPLEETHQRSNVSWGYEINKPTLKTFIDALHVIKRSIAYQGTQPQREHHIHECLFIV